MLKLLVSNIQNFRNAKFYSCQIKLVYRTLKELSGRLRKAKIKAGPTKCLLGASRMELLGHQVGGNVITPRCDNVEKLPNTPRRTTKKQVRSFLGLVGYYRDHKPAFTEISAPLTDLLKKGRLNMSSGARHRNVHTPY